ncbi:MAG: hypothetical protein IJW14_05200 [Oscillospiraceae bacterium]|nr:hypothetical protein [Oscillospiraceae bacterium]
MKTMMKILALVMALAMVLCLVACTDNGKPANTDPTGSSEPAPSTDPTTSSEPEATEDGKKEYTVVVKDADGNPVSGVLVQICKDGATCFTPSRTDDNGCAVWNLEEATDYYGTVSSLEEGMPKEYFGDQFEVTLVYTPPVTE